MDKLNIHQINNILIDKTNSLLNLKKNYLNLNNLNIKILKINNYIEYLQVQLDILSKGKKNIENIFDNLIENQPISDIINTNMKNSIFSKNLKKKNMEGMKGGEGASVYLNHDRDLQSQNTIELNKLNILLNKIYIPINKNLNNEICFQYSKKYDGIYLKLYKNVYVKVHKPKGIIKSNNYKKYKTIKCNKQNCIKEKCNYVHKNEKYNKMFNLDKCHYNIGVSNNNVNIISKLNLNDIKKILMYTVSDLYFCYEWFNYNKNLIDSNILILNDLDICES